jgi:hypothetical protein
VPALALENGDEMTLLTKILNAIGIRTPRQRRSTANRSAAQKQAWVKRKAKEVPHDVQ